MRCEVERCDLNEEKEAISIASNGAFFTRIESSESRIVIHISYIIFIHIQSHSFSHLRSITHTHTHIEILLSSMRSFSHYGLSLSLVFLLVLVSSSSLTISVIDATPLKPGVNQTRILFIGTDEFIHAPASHARASIPSYLSLILRNIGLTPEIHTRLLKGYTLGPNPFEKEYDPTQLDYAKMMEINDNGDEVEKRVRLTWPMCRGSEGGDCDVAHESDPTPPEYGHVSGSTPLVEVEKFLQAFEPKTLNHSHCFDEGTLKALTSDAQADGAWDYIIFQDDLRAPYLDYMLLHETYLGVYSLMNIALLYSPSVHFIWVNTWSPPLSPPLETPPLVQANDKFPNADLPHPTKEQLTTMSSIMGTRLTGWITAHARRDTFLYDSETRVAKEEAAPGEAVREVRMKPMQATSIRIAPVAEAWKIFSGHQTFTSFSQADAAMLKEFKSKTLLTETAESSHASAVGNFIAAVTLASSMTFKDPSCQSLNAKRACGFSIYCPSSTLAGVANGAHLLPAQLKAICHAMRDAARNAVLGVGYYTLTPPATGYTSVSERDEPSWTWQDDTHGEDNGPPPETPDPVDNNNPTPTTADVSSTGDSALVDTDTTSTATALPAEGEETKNTEAESSSGGSDEPSRPTSTDPDSNTGSDSNQQASNTHTQPTVTPTSSTESSTATHILPIPSNPEPTSGFSSSSTGISTDTASNPDGEKGQHTGSVNEPSKPIITIPDTADKCQCTFVYHSTACICCACDSVASALIRFPIVVVVVVVCVLQMELSLLLSYQYAQLWLLLV